MPLSPDWTDITLRLLCALIAGALFGLNRSERGRVAGLRTMILISLAACISMVQVNVLLSMSGKAQNSFVVLDLMRLPLGILSGMGFIGAGAIIRRDQLVIGVTTAATMWFVTVVGLCLGGGQIALGTVGTAIGVSVLSVLTIAEDRLRQDHQASLLLVCDASGPREDSIENLLRQAGIRVVSCAAATNNRVSRRTLKFELTWRAKARPIRTPEVVERLAKFPGIHRLVWTPVAN